MAWWNPFKKQETQPQPSAPDHKAAGVAAPPAKKETKPPAEPAMPKELEGAVPKGMMGKFYRMWKNPAFLKQLQVLSAHMAKDGVNIKDMEAVKAWLEKNKADIEAGKYKDLPQEGAKPQTYERTGPEVGRNDPCPCGSGKKYKKCHGATEATA